MPPRLIPLIDNLPETVPFVGPEAIERSRGIAFRARIGANENGFGPSPHVIDAMRDVAPEMWMYGDPENFELRSALARVHGVGADNVVIGEGVDGLLGLTVRQYIEPGMPVVTSLGGYPTFNYHVVGHGGRLVNVPYDRQAREDLDGLLDAVRRERPPLVYLANPDNPMGSWWPAEAVTAFMDALPEDTLLILDEAYCEMAPEGTCPPMLPLRPNVLRMRTFSKAYGLAGLRCGYAIGDARLIGPFNRVRNHFGMTRMAQAACLAALADTEYLSNVVGRIAASRETIAAIAADHGLVALPSATNFVAVDCGNAERALSIMNGLIDAGIFVRKPMAPGLDRCIRISCGPEADMEALGTALAELMQAERKAG